MSKNTPSAQEINALIEDIHKVCRKHVNDKETEYACKLLHSATAVYMANVIENLNEYTTDELSREFIKTRLFEDVEKYLKNNFH